MRRFRHFLDQKLHLSSDIIYVFLTYWTIHTMHPTNPHRPELTGRKYRNLIVAWWLYIVFQLAGPSTLQIGTALQTSGIHGVTDDIMGRCTRRTGCKAIVFFARLQNQSFHACMSFWYGTCIHSSDCWSLSMCHSYKASYLPWGGWLNCLTQLSAVSVWQDTRTRSWKYQAVLEIISGRAIM